MTDAAERLREVQSLESSADFLLAHDRAIAAAEEFPDDPEFRYLAVRSLARAGATRQAFDLYEKHALGVDGRPDHAALRARLEKDLALWVAGAQRSARLRDAARMYGALFRRWGGYYAAVNAATLFLLAGDDEVARGYARETLAYCVRDPERGDLDDYYRAASEAEAQLILGDTLEAMKALHKLASISRGDLAARAGTRRQLRLVLDAKRLNHSILDPLMPPRVVHFAGPKVPGSERMPPPDPGAERALAAAIGAALGRKNAGFAYGSLAGPADLLFAEACLQRGCELHLVLAGNAAAFRAAAAASWPAASMPRLEAVLDRAASLTVAVEGDIVADDSLSLYCSEIAMGKAILRSQYIDSDAVQFVVGSAADPAAEIARWRAGGRESIAIAAPAGFAPPPAATAGGKPAPVRRELRAMIFGDTVGFSRIAERQLPIYRAAFMGAVAEAVRAFGESVLAVNSWGDAVHAVTADAASGARCALEIQRHVNAIDYRGLGFGEPLQMRVSVHYGPVYAGADEFTGKPAYYGGAVTFAARMEPVTPPRQVYATEALAAQLALAGEIDIAADYVGKVALAKRFGTAPMYLLRPRARE